MAPLSTPSLPHSPPLLVHGSLHYHVLTPAHSTAALTLIAEAFSDEPTSVHLQASRERRLQQWRVFAAFFAEECASNDCSIVCIDTATTESESGSEYVSGAVGGRVAGVFWVRDFMFDLPGDFSVEGLDCIAPVVGVLEKLDNGYHELRPGLQKGECVDLWMLGVSPDYRKRGIAANLTSVAVEWMRTKGFSYVVLEASGGFSARCAEKAGWCIILNPFPV